jgi:dihydrofolate synthase/folylpolyglutamate synthase
MNFKSFDEAEEFLNISVAKTKGGEYTGGKRFVSSQLFFEKLGDIQDDRPTIHIAGTSGKGTIAAMLELMLLAHGKSVVMISSPHVYSLTERTRINSNPISEELFLECLNEILPVYEGLEESGETVTYFEINVAISFLAAKKMEPDYVIVETGLGGKYDTTNVIKRPDKLCVIGQIGYDHINILGKTLPTIARQKAGIIHQGQTAVVLQQTKKVNDVFEKAAARKLAKLTWVDDSRSRQEIGDLKQINYSLTSNHQYQNAAMALRAASKVAERDGWSFDRQKALNSLEDFSLPGRFEIIDFKGKTLVMDGAHNQQKIQAVMDTMGKVFEKRSFSTVFASGQQILAPKLLKMVRAQSDEVILTSYKSNNLDMIKPCFDFSEIAAETGLKYLMTGPEVIDEIENSDQELWLITGSFYHLASIKNSIEVRSKALAI